MYKIKITLQYIEPTIWRCILVSEAISLHKLNHMIQAAMGWKNSHLHEFEINDTRYGFPDMGGFDADLLDAKNYTVANVLKQGDVCCYTYDMGDDWQHVIEIESVAPSFGRTKAPACIDGERACPPEDCGGYPGYEELLEVLADPDHEEHKSMLKWLKTPYNPDVFSAQLATRRMRSNLWQTMER